jgi:hypothetical protein
MNSEALQKYAPLLIVLVLVIAAVYVYSSTGGTTSNTLVPGTDNSALNAANAQTNAQLAIQHEQDVLGGFSSLVNYAEQADNNATSLAGAYATARTTAITGNQNAQVSIAQINANLEAQQAQAHALQQASVWSSIGSIFGSAASIIPGLGAARAARQTITAPPPVYSTIPAGAVLA